MNQKNGPLECEAENATTKHIAAVCHICSAEVSWSGQSTIHYVVAFCSEDTKKLVSCQPVAPSTFLIPRWQCTSRG